MREIKFRAFVDGKIVNIKVIHFFKDGKPVIEYKDGIRTMCKEAKPDELMQYTGLKDKYGVDIYEGDVIKGQWINKDDDLISTFIVQDHYPFNEPTGSSSGFLCHTSISPCNFAVIGNKFENPELAEQR